MIHRVQGNIYFKKTTQMHQQREVLKYGKRLRIKISLEKMEARRCQSGTKQVNAKHTAESLIQHQVRPHEFSSDKGLCGWPLAGGCAEGGVPSSAPSDPTAAAYSQLHQLKLPCIIVAATAGLRGLWGSLPTQDIL